MDFSDLFAAFGLALVLEGVAYALFPDVMRNMMTQILSLPVSNLRLVGLVAAVVGVGIVWLVRT
jgi:uncharacterized protein